MSIKPRNNHGEQNALALRIWKEIKASKLFPFISVGKVDRMSKNLIWEINQVDLSLERIQTPTEVK